MFLLVDHTVGDIVTGLSGPGRVEETSRLTCTICNQFQGKWKIASRSESSARRGTRNHISPRFNWVDLEASARLCYCCDIILAGCRGCFRQHGVEEEDIVEGVLRFYYPHSLEDVDDAAMDKELVFRMADGRKFEIEMFVTESADCLMPDEWDYIPVSRITSPRTDSDAALATIKGWIAGCIVSHDFCDSPENPTLPTRVVDVGLDDGVVRLVETNGARSKYLCLSHCWGKAQIITTETGTLEERKRSIAWGDLSKTFQDAILFTRTLGFRYIWIDSLCILQDSLRDWEVESAKMASVYSQGHLTIAATHSNNGYGGLFSANEDVKISGKTPGGEDYCLHFRERIDHHVEVVQDYSSKDVPGYATVVHHALMTRAWVYQERMLSTRVLHFGRYEAFFECRSHIQCECEGIWMHGASASPIAVIKTEHGDALDTHRQQQQEGDTSPEVVYQQARLWRTMICSYSALFLTKSKDRLPAIGGLAKDMASQRKSRYLAGIWEDTLNDDLLWSVQTPTGRKARPHPMVAPSWSWASVETHVLYFDQILYSDPDSEIAEFLVERPPYEHYSTIEMCEVRWTAVDEFGSIASGTLTISGLLQKGVLERALEVRDGVDTIVHYVLVRHLRLEVKTDYLMDHHGADVFCLRMSRIQEGSTDYLVSLVLIESPTSNDCFERIGAILQGARPPPVDPVGELFENSSQQIVTII